MTPFWRRVMNMTDGPHFHRRPGANRWEIIWEGDRQRGNVKLCGTDDCQRMTWTEFFQTALQEAQR